MVMADPASTLPGYCRAHGESGTENPEDVLFPGAVQKHNFAVGTSRECGTHIEDKHGEQVISVKIDYASWRSCMLMDDSWVWTQG
jgi:hypothetical protein